MTYNLTIVQSSASIFTLVQQANVFSGGLLMTLFTIAIFFIMVISLKAYTFSKAILASSVMCLVISLFFVYAKLINPIWSLAFLILAALTVLFGTMFD